MLLVTVISSLSDITPQLSSNARTGVVQPRGPITNLSPAYQGSAIVLVCLTRRKLMTRSWSMPGLIRTDGWLTVTLAVAHLRLLRWTDSANERETPAEQSEVAPD